MMEESSDESAEIITNEEAEMAKKMQESIEKSTGVTIPLSEGTFSPVSAPTPLPAFMNVSSSNTSGSAEAQTSTTSLSPSQNITVTPTKSISEPKTPVTKASSPPRVVTAPAPVQSPYEASKQIQIPPEMVPEVTAPSSPGASGGLFGWITGNKLMTKVVEKTKSSMETMITTLDPGMKEVIKSGGGMEVVVTSMKENKVGAVREAFQTVFGRATVMGVETQANTAAQPVGFTAGLKGAEERIQHLRQKGSIPDGFPVVSVEGFIVEMLPDRWYEMSCVLLQDPEHRVELQTFSQPTPIPAEYILKAQDSTPSDYPQRWSGLKVTIGEVIEQSQPHIGHADWQNVLVGVSRRESLFLAAKALAYMYKERLPTSVIS